MPHQLSKLVPFADRPWPEWLRFVCVIALLLAGGCATTITAAPTVFPEASWAAAQHPGLARIYHYPLEQTARSAGRLLWCL